MSGANRESGMIVPRAKKMMNMWAGALMSIALAGAATANAAERWSDAELALLATLRLSQLPPPPVDSSGPSIFTAVQDKLGLKLEGTKAPVKVIVIDAIEKPSEN